MVFLSTLPARGATFENLDIRPITPEISIHAPREGSDTNGSAAAALAGNFYPRSPRGERQNFQCRVLELYNISIHAPREGSDTRLADSRPGRTDFYPRSPRGERPESKLALAFVSALFLSTLPARGATCPLVRRGGRRAFLSTLPARGATQPAAAGDLHRVISIHAPREGSDRRSTRKRVKSARNFYPRSPRGERLSMSSPKSVKVTISIHAPREGSDGRE